MALTFHTFKFLQKIEEEIKPMGNVLSIGRINNLILKDEYKKLSIDKSNDIYADKILLENFNIDSLESLDYSDFEGANIRKADFSNAMLDGAVFLNANLFRVNFSYASLVGADFTFAQMTQLNFEGGDLRNATINEAFLTNVYFGGANLLNADLFRLDDYNLTDEEFEDFKRRGARI